MKMIRVTVEGYQKINTMDIQVHAPILLIAGKNEAGKSSLSDAIRHAFLNEPGRVKSQKDFGDLVHDDGRKKGYVSVEWDRAGAIHGTSVVVPAGTRTTDIEPTTIHRCLMNYRHFAAMPNPDRRALLFSVNKIRVTGATIREKLIECGANAAKVESIASILLGGFAAAEKEARAKTSEARGSWKTTTGEVYGVNKAATWKALQLEWSQAAIDESEGLVSMANDLLIQSNIDLGALYEKKRSADATAARRTTLEATAATLERVTSKLATDQGELEKWKAKVIETREKATGVRETPSLACPHCAGLVVINKGKLDTYVAPDKVADPEAIAQLATYEQSLATVQSWVQNDQRDLAAANNAIAALSEMAANDAQPFSQADLDEAIQRNARLTTERAAAQRTLTAEQEKMATAKVATSKTELAQGYHTDIKEWGVIADLLAPEGIQSKMMADALAPIRDRLQKTATATGWPLVGIDDDMTIRIGGRPYGLNSQSAMWRADAALTEAISYLSGERFFMLDEVDVLDNGNRMAFLKWLHGIAAAREVDTALVSGTFKEAPTCPPTFQVEWVQDGMVREALKEAA